MHGERIMTTAMEAVWWLYALLGVGAGFFAGLLGVGGGIVITPVLIDIFARSPQFDSHIITHLAIGTTFGLILCTAPFSVWMHARQKQIAWRLGAKMGGVIVIGSYAGSLIAATAAQWILQLLLTAVLFFNSYRMFSPTASAAARTTATIPTIPFPHLAAMALGIGVFSAMAGIAGGMLTVPALVHYRVPLRTAIGTAAFVGLFIAAAAACGYAVNGVFVNTAPLPNGALGFIYLPALAYIVLFSGAAALLGARLTARLPTRILRWIFGSLTALLGARLLWILLG